jgi:DNA-binding NarL/FixJ family response regulator
MDNLKARIFLIEHEKNFSYNDRREMRKNGYDIIGRSTKAEKALKQIARRRPDVIFCDIILQGKMDGLEFITELKTNYDIPVVLFTDFIGERLFDRADSIEPTEILLKPLTITLFTNTTDAVLANPARKYSRESFTFMAS